MNEGQRRIGNTGRKDAGDVWDDRLVTRTSAGEERTKNQPFKPALLIGSNGLLKALQVERSGIIYRDCMEISPQAHFTSLGLLVRTPQRAYFF